MCPHTTSSPSGAEKVWEVDWDTFVVVPSFRTRPRHGHAPQASRSSSL